MPKNKIKKRGPGRPPLAVKRIFKSVAIPIDLWRECFAQAQQHGTFIGRVAWNRIKNGVYDPDQDARDRAEEQKRGMRKMTSGMPISSKVSRRFMRQK